MSAGPKLTRRQIECLRLIAEGCTTQEIADALGLSRHTVEHYVAAACDRLNAKTRSQAVALAVAQNLLSGHLQGGL